MHHTTDWKDTINAKGFTHESTEEINAKEARYHYFQECPIYPDELISNLGIFLNAKELARILFLDNLYKQILGDPWRYYGVWYAMGCRCFLVFRTSRSL